MEDWVTLAIFEFYLRFIYTGQLSGENIDDLWTVSSKSGKKSIEDFSNNELIDFYKFAHFTKND